MDWRFPLSRTMPLLSPLSIPPSPHGALAALRKQALQALQSGDLRGFDLAREKGWTPDLHDRYNASTRISPIAKDIFTLAIAKGPTFQAEEQLAARSISHLFSHFPETVWELAWTHPFYKDHDRRSGIADAWANSSSAFKAQIVPLLPVGFGEGSLEAPSLAQLQCIVLPRSFKDPAEVSPTPFFGFFLSPLWANFKSKALGQDGSERSLAMELLANLYARICCAHCALSQFGETQAAQRAASWMEALDAEMKPISQAGCGEWNRNALRAAALYCIAADQSLSLSKAFLYLNEGPAGDEEALAGARSDKEAKSRLSELNVYLAGPPSSIQIKAEKDMDRFSRFFTMIVSRATAFDKAIPWRMLAAKHRAVACLDYFIDQWGVSTPHPALLSKHVTFRPPLGLLRKGEQDALRARERSEAREAEVRHIFDKQARQSSLLIASSQLPDQLKGLLLGQTPPSLAPGHTLPRLANAVHAESREKQELDNNLLAKATKRALSGKPFVFQQSLSFGWAAAALCLKCDPSLLKRALSPGSLAIAAEQSKWLIESLSWDPAGVAAIEQDALWTSSGNNCAGPQRKPRL